ncbi:hypothetical protein [Sharpea porci]|uniref:hypothetical protein n=1 Tax=Sharpea porci TaxID=2652286 RepID=UPI002A9120A3|nr:hypothetical protein [Sharpea porci]MDY5279458.1 hypothetical protein [Sharpea porci]
METNKHNKQVFLFELDSVRKTDEEIIYGQEMLFDEIVRNGNVVVLTYNQLIDSRGFFSLINDPQMYEYLMELFNQGYIKISQYGSIRTVAQYVLESIEKNLNTTNENFIYSAVPVKSNQKYLLDLMKRSLIYSDFSEIDEYISGQNKDLDKLFKSVGKETKKVNHDNAIEQLKHLRQFIKLTLDVSAKPEFYNPPRKLKQDKKDKEITFRTILNYVIYYIKNTKEYIDKDNIYMWESAIKILEELNEEIDENIMSRTIWHQKLLNQYNNDNIEHYQYAEAIVDLCYNYRQELSIYNVSKHYNTQELKNIIKGGDAPTFTADFFRRLKQDWKVTNTQDERYLQEEKNNIKLFEDFKHLPNWKVGMSILKVVRNTKYKEDRLYSYETNYNYQRKVRTMKAVKSLFALILVCVLFILISTVIEISLGSLQDFLVSNTGLAHTFLMDLLKNLIWVIVFVVFSDALMKLIENVLKKLPFVNRLVFLSLDIKEAFITQGRAIKDICFIATHRVKQEIISESNIVEQENFQEQITIPLPYEIKEYMKLYNQPNNELFKGKDLLSKEELNHGHVLREYALEHGIKIGMTYKVPIIQC